MSWLLIYPSKMIEQNIIHMFQHKVLHIFLLRARRSFCYDKLHSTIWKIFVVACVDIFEKEYQSAYWIVGARITLQLDSKSGSCEVYCYCNDIEGTTCLHRPSINPLATASKFPAILSATNCAYTEIQNLFQDLLSHKSVLYFVLFIFQASRI